MEKGKVFPSRPLHALSVLSQRTAPHNDLARERQGGSPPPGPLPSQCCRTDTASGFQDLRGCDSPRAICIRRASGGRRSAAGTERRGGSFPRAGGAELFGTRAAFFSYPAPQPPEEEPQAHRHRKDTALERRKPGSRHRFTPFKLYT